MDFKIGILDLKMEPFSLQGNWVDLLILVVLLYFIVEAVRVGIWAFLADFLSFSLSLLISLRGYKFAATLLRNNFSLSHSLANALGFLLTAILSESILGVFFTGILGKIPYKKQKTPLSRIAAVIPAVGEGLVLISFVLVLLMGLPVSPQVKSDISESKIGGEVVRRTSGIETSINEIFGGVVEDSLTYLTVRPGSRETVPISVDKRELGVDEVAETEMFRLINEERVKRGVQPLEKREEVVSVARAHARDMWERRYFGHVSPEGEDVGDRLENAGISYRIAGENLALAPTLATAHTGLMNSEGHRENILDPKFKRVGIGVIDNGIYGKMFVQVFTD